MDDSNPMLFVSGHVARHLQREEFCVSSTISNELCMGALLIHTAVG